MKTSLSEDQLLALLSAPGLSAAGLSLPRVSLGIGALMTVLATGCDGCTCADSAPYETVVPLARAQYDQLLAQYGANGVPINECQLICAVSGGAAGGAGEGGGGGGAGGTGFGDGGGTGGLGGAGSGGDGGGAGGMGFGGMGIGGMGVGGAGIGGMGGGGMGVGGTGGGGTGVGGTGGDGSTTTSTTTTTTTTTSGGETRDYNVASCLLTTIEFDGGGVICTYDGADCSSGRRPVGLFGCRKPRDRTVASYFARAAHLEAASVVAFRDLARELSLHGAPSGLVAAAHESARDEARHARIMTAFALVAGGRLERVRTRPFEMRSLEALAVHNAQEGIAGEGFGALLLLAQSRAARPPLVRHALASIARDEARHASFSMTLGRALNPRLSHVARRRVRDAREEALLAISRANERDPSSAEANALGMPSAERAQDLVRVMRRVIDRAEV